MSMIVRFLFENSLSWSTYILTDHNIVRVGSEAVHLLHKHTVHGPCSIEPHNPGRPVPTRSENIIGWALGESRPSSIKASLSTHRPAEAVSR
jgi:hypothetical protein